MAPFVVVPFMVVAFGVLPEQVFLALGFLIPVAVAVGVLRYHLLDIEVVVRRGLVYGLLTAAVIGVYVVVTAAAGARLDRGPLPGVVAAALVAVGLTPLRDRLQGAVDRLIYGERRDPMRAVTRLGDRVAAAGETDLLPAAVATVTEAVRATGAAVLSPDGSVLVTYGTGSDDSTAEQLPLRVGGRDLGVLRVARRAPHEPYTDGDRRLLAAPAPQVAVVGSPSRGRRCRLAGRDWCSLGRWWPGTVALRSPRPCSALQAFERMGATAEADRAAALLRGLGVKGRTGPRKLGLLSRREHEVLSLVAEGCPTPRSLDGKIVEITQYCDLFTIMSKIGALPTAAPAG